MLQQPPRPEPQIPPVVHVVTFEQFQSTKPSEFEGTTDPTKARAWLKEMGKAFALVKFDEDQKTDFTSYFLKGEENYWWESKKALEGKGIVTWDRFTELFLEKFVPVQVDIEEKRAKRFQQGLKPWIHSGVAVLELTTYTTVVQKAMIIEEERNHQTPLPYCKTCDRKQTSVCNKANVICFKCKHKGHYSNECSAGRTEVIYFPCGKKGHVVRDCRGPTMAASVPKLLELPPPPQHNQPRARTFNMTLKEAVQSPNMIAGTISVDSIDVKLLINSGATRSFISEDFINK
ncbi:uncharacterized protein LOC141685656 [Apium graveolens]|uniref:uncharacterized protein LOC141685656 n=1 Tax=Apium graveolens TaxID=4045 RepID=UPI003D7A345C